MLYKILQHRKRKVVFIISTVTNGLFASNAVFVSDADNQDEVFAEIYGHLVADGYVTGDFLEHVVQREHEYPTGIDTSPISSDLPNIAIPHTEGEFVNTCLIVPVKLNHEIKFNNMIDPSQELNVKFLFMILNNNPEGQANILAQIMDFLAQTPVDQLNELFQMEDATQIFEFLSQNFKQAN